MNSPPDWHSVPLPWQADNWRQAHAWITAGKLPHALLITGVAGNGKELFAQAFAALLLCRQPESNRACGQCASCRQFAAGGHPDYRSLSVAEDKSAILVDQVRELCAALTLTSQYRGRKVALLMPADAMNVNAANSLLKTLEEPTDDTLLILVSAHPARLPATVRSRCQMLRMTAPVPKTAVTWLNERVLRPDWPALLDIAGGGPLLALQLADSELVRERLVFYRKLTDVQAGLRDPLACAAELSREPPAVVLRLLQAWTMDLIVMATAGQAAQTNLVNADARALLQTALQSINLRGLHGFLSRLNETLALLTTTVNTQLLLESLIIEWADGLRGLSAAPLAAPAGVSA